MIIFGISLSTSDLWLLGICGTLCTILIPFSFYRYKSFCAASIIFRNKVLTELEGLYPTPTNWPKNSMDIVHILREKYPRIEIAVNIFKGHLSIWRVKGFNKAWVKYYSENEIEGQQCYYHYVPISGTSVENSIETTNDNTKTYKDDFKHNVYNLLKYAKQK